MKQYLSDEDLEKFLVELETLHPGAIAHHVWVLSTPDSHASELSPIAARIAHTAHKSKTIDKYRNDDDERLVGRVIRDVKNALIKKYNIDMQGRI